MFGLTPSARRSILNNSWIISRYTQSQRRAFASSTSRWSSEVDTSQDQSEEQPAAKKKPRTAKNERKAMPSEEKGFSVGVNESGERFVDLGNKRRATVRFYKGFKYLDIREYYEDDYENLLPGKKGLTLTQEQWETLRSSRDVIDSFFALQQNSLGQIRDVFPSDFDNWLGQSEASDTPGRDTNGARRHRPTSTTIPPLRYLPISSIPTQLTNPLYRADSRILNMAMKPQPQLLAKFLRAMKTVYGPFDMLTPAQATAWTPPPMAEGHRGRYLWTDAFGVLNFITLSTVTANPVYTTLAARLIQAVHDTLGRTRSGTARLPGASDAHPLRGGLRIGKEDEEDDPGGDGDGQYHHYLTIWMFALNRMARAAQERRYNDLAIELAQAIHPRFVRDRNAPRPRMYWKMSIDLRRPLVLSEGNLDPIDGYVIFNLLQRGHGANSTVLESEISEYRRILETKWRRYLSDDPLDLGMTLWTAHWFDGQEEWATVLTQRAVACLRALFEEEKFFDIPARYRLAFREFGTCLGIRCHIEKLNDEPHPQDAGYWDVCAREVVTTWEPSIDAAAAGGVVAVPLPFARNWCQLRW
ncbi:hypothetical protein A0H81_12331 [Grifola frondosa]|uniref:Transcriptional coactivator p15 (PC4) C-terminal domain-containing protein n=1 Tax=Grifola frondosa TaxID=5627 RepID=A0A1C7LRW7_GRIFR|nr:hypothetical protein A0H81_12331 [Grifola frondosa]